MSKQVWLAYALLFFAAACGSSSSPESLGEKPGETRGKELLQAIIRYAGKLPSRATQETKFEARFDDYYEDLANKHRIDLYYEDEANGDIYLLASRIAPSLHEKRVGIGIRLQFAADSLVYYEERFRTWKMPEAELAEKGALLFAKMAKGEDLSPYYPQNSGEEEYIEFPDADTYFDLENRVWRSTRPNPVEPYYPLKQSE